MVPTEYVEQMLVQNRRGKYRRRAQYWRTKRGFALFYLQEPIYNVLVIFFGFETRVYVRFVNS